MKKKISIGFVFSIAILLICIWSSGYSYEPSAYIADFCLSEDGNEMIFTVGVGSSMGYVRGFKDEGGGDKPHYLKFYSAWGGFNSSIGAKNQYTLRLNQKDTEIYVYHGYSGYKLVLQKDVNSGEWSRVK